MHALKGDFMKKYCVLYNPYSASGKGEILATKLKHILGDELYFISTSHIKNYNEFFDFTSDDIILCGGDGTLNHFVNDIRNINYNNRIYYYPCGSGNDFFNDIGKDKLKPIEITDYIKNLPVVIFNDEEHFFLNGVGMGLDGYCCENVNEQKNNNKKGNYTLTALKGILYDYKPVNAHVNVDEHHYDFKNVWLAPTMKGKFYGGGMKVAPNQDRNSDSLSLVVVHDVSRVKLLSILPTVFSGNHIKKDKVVTVLEGQNIDVEFDCACSIQLDGETFDNVSKYSAKIYSKRK